MLKKLAVTFPQMHEFGGGEIFCEYIVNLLVKKYKIDLFYYSNQRINKKLKINKKVNINPLKSNNPIVDFFCKRYIFLAQIYLIFYLAKKKYYIVISGAGEFFHESKCIQYIHHPFYSLNPKHYLSLGLKKRNILKIVLRFLISLIFRLILILNRKKYNKTFTLVNSKFIKKRFQSIYKKNKATIIYPTFKIQDKNFCNLRHFNKKNNDFVILGRVSRDKNAIEAINFFINFKKNYPELKIGKLHVIGPVEKNLKKLILNIKKTNSDCKFYGYLKLKKRDKILKKSKYGLHFFIGEHFGRSVLEMQKNGIIVFCHNSGGAMEIVANHHQKFESKEELNKKLKIVLSSNKINIKILRDINNKIKMYNDKKFKQNFLKIINEY